MQSREFRITCIELQFAYISCTSVGSKTENIGPGGLLQIEFGGHTPVMLFGSVAFTIISQMRCLMTSFDYFRR